MDDPLFYPHLSRPILATSSSFVIPISPSSSSSFRQTNTVTRPSKGKEKARKESEDGPPPDMLQEERAADERRVVLGQVVWEDVLKTSVGREKILVKSLHASCPSRPLSTHL